MDDTSPGPQARTDDQLFDDAIRIAEAWGADGRTITGMWLHRRHLSIGVGIAEGDEIETTESLRRLVSSRVSIRTRVASSRLAELWQLQADVDTYMDETELWQRWAASLGVDERSDVLEVGLIPGTPPGVHDRIRGRFPDAPLVFTSQRRAIAL